MTIMLLLSLLAVACNNPAGDRSRATERLNVQDVLGGDAEGFARAIEPREFVFPNDHGPHPAFRTEWWYLTGNLASNNGDRFGFQLTFFRSSLDPGNRPANGWRTGQVYMAHFAVTDVAGGRFHSFERFARGANGLAGAAGMPMRVWLDDWWLEIDGGERPVVRLAAGEGDVHLELRATSEKDPVLQGDRGLSQKGSQRGNASYYYSLTRLDASGSVTLPGGTADVTGSVWMDREWSTSVLEASQVGWDWFSLQLDDGSDLMYYQLRGEDGSAGPTSKGVLLTPDGERVDLEREDVSIEVIDSWQSPLGGDYPAKWRLRARAASVELTIEPMMPDQELDHSFRYWEGAVRVTGDRDDRPVSGYGYVEMTGYAR